MGNNRSGGFKGPAGQAGVGLLEVLIAVLVLAIGMLGMAALQAVTLKNSSGSVERSQAVIQSYSLFDTLRLNRTSAVAGAYDVTGWSCAAVVAEAGDTHNYSVFNGWLAGVQRDMGASTCGKLDCDEFGNCTVGVQWDDRAQGSGTLKLETTTRL